MSGRERYWAQRMRFFDRAFNRRWAVGCDALGQKYLVDLDVYGRRSKRRGKFRY